jgi:hypothetical protein
VWWVLGWNPHGVACGENSDRSYSSLKLSCKSHQVVAGTLKLRNVSFHLALGAALMVSLSAMLR